MSFTHFKSGHLTNGFLKNRILIIQRTRKNWNGGNVGESDLHDKWVQLRLSVVLVHVQTIYSRGRLKEYYSV